MICEKCEALSALIDGYRRERDEARELNAEWAEKAATWIASPEAAQRLDGYRKLGQQVAEAQRERDEARAKIAGLPAWQKGCEQALGDLADAEEAIARLYTERDEARASVADAYRRGAEDMRLACQQWCRAWENNGEAIADALADLRVEDKP